jgi:hypothetical protein
MVYPLPWGETVTLLRQGASPGRDSKGVVIPGPVQEIDVPGCAVTPRQVSVALGGPEQQGRDSTSTGWTVYAPPGTAVLTTDQARIRGTVYPITGEPVDWGTSPFTGTAGPVAFDADLPHG